MNSYSGYETGVEKDLGCMDQIKLSSINDVTAVMERVKDFVTTKHSLGEWESYEELDWNSDQICK